MTKVRNFVEITPNLPFSEFNFYELYRETFEKSELSKAHHHELVTAIELDGVPVALVAVDTLLELIFVEDRHDLSEDCFSFVHGLRMAS